MRIIPAAEAVLLHHHPRLKLDLSQSLEVLRQSLYHQGWISDMDPESSRTARESLDLAFYMSNILDTRLDRHTLSVLVALCEHGLNPESLAALVKELWREPSPPPASTHS